MKLHMTPYALKRLTLLPLLIMLGVIVIFPTVGYGQKPAMAQKREKAEELFAAHRLTEALPLLEELAEANPEDARLQFQLGFALLAQVMHAEKLEERTGLRIRARKAFVNARELGDESELVKALIESIPIDGTENLEYSKNPIADAIMRQAEMYFTSGKMKEALEAYQQTLIVDPKNYHAALFSGDVYTHTGKYDDAEKWYKKAMEINPDVETAYRYSATPLMKQRKFSQARDRYIEAWIVEPYNRFAIGGLSQWGEATNTPLSHPRLNRPSVTIGEDGKLSSNIMMDPTDESAFVWIAYVATRTEWFEKKFKQQFPAEKEYRHTLREESEALRGVIKLAKEQKDKGKKIGDQMESLLRLEQEGVLEAYILMALPDRGIAADHAEYLKGNREKLRKYVLRFVVGAK